MKFDKNLAARVINKIGKEIAAAMNEEDPEELKKRLRRALNDLNFLPDVLHFYDDIDVINPNRV